MIMDQILKWLLGVAVALLIVTGITVMIRDATITRLQTKVHNLNVELIAANAAISVCRFESESKSAKAKLLNKLEKKHERTKVDYSSGSHMLSI